MNQNGLEMDRKIMEKAWRLERTRNGQKQTQNGLSDLEMDRNKLEIAECYRNGPECARN